MNILRPSYHITPKQGWINDPNGFVWFNGRYHIYCQHNPHDTKWGPMHWLHFISEDLIDFEEVGISLKPDQEYDKELGCFSGSAIEIDGKLYVLYTGCSNGKQTQCLAVSNNGHTFEKSIHNPVLAEKDLPEGYMIADFRDPKVFKKNGLYHVLLACRHKDGYSSILLFSGIDLLNLKFKSVLKSFYSCQEGGMVECPDIIFDGDRCALLYSLQKPLREGEKFQNRFPVAYTVGRLDLAKGTFDEEGNEHELDNEFVCYATQSLQKEDKNYLVYWQSSWDIEDCPTVKEGYVGQLSLVKEARIEGDRIKLDFLPSSKRQSIVVEISSDQASLSLRNVDIQISKPDKRIEIRLHGSDDLRYFHLNDVNKINIDYVYDNSCVELRFQGGEAFASLLDFSQEDSEEVIIKTKGCKIINP